MNEYLWIFKVVQLQDRVEKVLELNFEYSMAKCGYIEICVRVLFEPPDSEQKKW